VAKRAGELVIIFRPSMAADFENALSGAKLFYSLWPGYLEKGGLDLEGWCAAHGVAFEIHHTSGHAGISDLQRLVDALQPKRVIRIHSFAPNDSRTFSRMFSLLTTGNGSRYKALLNLGFPPRLVMPRPGVLEKMRALLVRPLVEHLAICATTLRASVPDVPPLSFLKTWAALLNW